MNWGLSLLVFGGACLCAHAAVLPEYRAVRNCAACHTQAKTHPMTPMAHALESVAECSILKDHPRMTFSYGPYSYVIERQGDRSIYSVTDGQHTIRAPVGWAFGLGNAGQTYVFENDGVLYESRVSYFKDVNGLDWTLGANTQKPNDLITAAGRPLGDDKVACFQCHATNAAEHRQLTLEKMIPGVQCERCHGPTEKHLEGLRTGDKTLAAMKSLKTLSTEELSNFCGQCHRTWAQIQLEGHFGITDVRYQPYRLTNSKCYDAEDSRISCVSCHDPHAEIHRNAASYDAKCQACHGGGKPEAKACPVAKSNCVSCHMPKIEIPGSHYRFSDHQIRIVRAHAAYPN